MPGLNALWAKYGCTKCNNYKLLVLEVDISDSKSNFVNNYVNKYGVKCPAIAKGDGAEQLCKAIDHEGAGAAGPDYLVKPDKTSKLFPNDAEVNNSGGNVQHVCGSSHTCAEQRPAAPCGISIRSRGDGTLDISVPGTEHYRISAYTTDGRRIAHRLTRLEAGENSVRLKGAFGSARVTIVSVKSANGSVTQTVIR